MKPFVFRFTAAAKLSLPARIQGMMPDDRLPSPALSAGKPAIWNAYPRTNGLDLRQFFLNGVFLLPQPERPTRQVIIAARLKNEQF